MATAGNAEQDAVYTNAGARTTPRAGPALSIDVSRTKASRQQQLALQTQQAQEYEAEAQRGMQEDSPNSSGDEVANGLRIHNGDPSGEHDGMEDEGEDMDDAGSFSDSLSSSPSIPDDDIDFALVYALHNFLATVDGQASVVKGNKLLLLDDSNSYWWLVRVLTSQAVGYIPAENIETPYERLARLNKHRNVDVSTSYHSATYDY